MFATAKNCYYYCFFAEINCYDYYERMNDYEFGCVDYEIFVLYFHPQNPLVFGVDLSYYWCCCCFGRCCNNASVALDINFSEFYFYIFYATQVRLLLLLLLYWIVALDYFFYVSKFWVSGMAFRFLEVSVVGRVLEALFLKMDDLELRWQTVFWCDYILKSFRESQDSLM